MSEIEQMKEQHEKISAPRKREVTITLVEPVTFGSETVKQLTLTAPRGKHLKMLPSEPALKDILNMASKVSGVSSAVFDEMCSQDIIAVAEAMGELL